jgi:hypothetical protein
MTVPLYWAARRCDDDTVVAAVPDEAELRAVFHIEARAHTVRSMSAPVGP